MERQHILISQLKSLKKVDDTTKALFASIFSPICLPKKQALNLNGSNGRSIYYLIDGFTLTVEVADHRFAFRTYPVQFQKRGHFTIQRNLYQHKYQLVALQCSSLLETTFDDLKEIIAIDPNVTDILNYVQAQVQEQHLQHIRLLTLTNAKRRYEILEEMLGTDFHHIPQKFLAPYLGISRKHLGRINRLKLMEHRNDRSPSTSGSLI